MLQYDFRNLSHYFHEVDFVQKQVLYAIARSLEKPSYSIDYTNELTDPDGPATEAWWDSYDWALMDAPEAAKPTWEEAQLIWRLAKISRIEELKVPARIAVQARNYFNTAPVAHSQSEKPVYVGGGLAHMPAMTHLVERSGVAGQRHPVMVMRDEDGKAVTLWTEEHAREALSTVAERTNLSESAYNIIKAKYEALAAELQFDRATLDEAAIVALEAKRDALLEAFKPENMEKEYRALMDRLAGDDYLPPDDELDTIKDLFIGRTGEAANKIRSRIVDVKIAQDAYTEAACDEQKRALEAVADARQQINRRIREAETAAKVKTIYRDGVFAMDAIPVDNSPVWTDTDDETLIPGRGGYVFMPLPQPTGGARPTVTVKVRNPAASELKGGTKLADLKGAPTAHFEAGTRGWAMLSGRPNAEDVREITLTWGGSGTLNVGAEVTVIARNRCGPTPLKIKFTAPVRAPAGD